MPDETPAIEGRSPEAATPDNLPVADKGSRRLGMAILLVAFGGFGGWALSANLAVAVVAPGSVSVESFKKTLQHLEGGIVQRILVEDGQRVAAGETLLVIDDTKVRAELQMARSEYAIARASEIRLLAEQSGRQALVFPRDLTGTDSARVREVIRVQRRLFQSRRDSLQSALSSHDEQVVQMQEQIAGLEERTQIARRHIRSLDGEAADYRSLFDKGLGNNQRMRELERQRLRLESEIAQNRSEAASLKSRISENRLEKEMRVQDFQQDVGERLREVQAQLVDAEERIIALQDQSRRTHVTAPVDGTVLGLRVHTIGAVARPGDPLLDLVPAGDGFVVEARVPDRDIDNIFVGQLAEIRFSAFNQRLSNVIDGEVVHVSADSFEDEATRARYYKARVKVTERGQDKMTEGMQLLAGMPAEVMIRTGERTFASYIAKPIHDILARAIRED